VVQGKDIRHNVETVGMGRVATKSPSPTVS